jgi:hypothetical protein
LQELRKIYTISWVFVNPFDPKPSVKVLVLFPFWHQISFWSGKSRINHALRLLFRANYLANACKVSDFAAPLASLFCLKAAHTRSQDRGDMEGKAG